MCFYPASANSVTQRDIARALGISNATVSLALRDSELLTRERREEVQAAAKRMGYRHNANAAELARHKHGSSKTPARAALAWIEAGGPDGETHSRLQLDACRKGAEEAARKFGYDLEVVRIGHDFTPGDLRGCLETQNFRGICFLPQDSSLAWQGFPWMDYPVVQFGQMLDDFPCDVISSDHVSNAMLAFARMRELGYRRIGLLANDDHSTKHHGRLTEAGFLTAQRSVASSERVPVFFVGADFDKKLAERLMKWVRENRIDGILSDVDCGLEILSDCGLRVPGDVGLARLDALDGRALAGIRPHFEEIGRAGLVLLHSLIVSNDFRVSGRARQLLVAGDWVDGESLPDRAG